MEALASKSLMSGTYSTVTEAYCQSLNTTGDSEEQTLKISQFRRGPLTDSRMETAVGFRALFPSPSQGCSLAQQEVLVIEFEVVPL